MGDGGEHGCPLSEVVLQPRLHGVQGSRHGPDLGNAAPFIQWRGVKVTGQPQGGFLKPAQRVAQPVDGDHRDGDGRRAEQEQEEQLLQQVVTALERATQQEADPGAVGEQDLKRVDFRTLFPDPEQDASDFAGLGCPPVRAAEGILGQKAEGQQRGFEVIGRGGGRPRFQRYVEEA